MKMVDCSANNDNIKQSDKLLFLYCLDSLKEYKKGTLQFTLNAKITKNPLLSAMLYQLSSFMIVFSVETFAVLFSERLRLRLNRWVIHCEK
jgi:hypothetical protein